MTERIVSPERKDKPNFTIKECQQNAQKLIDKYSVCLFLFDIKGSRKYLSADRQKIQESLKETIVEMNQMFDEYFPVNNLVSPYRQEKGFYSLYGDGSVVAINNAQSIPKIIDHIHQKVPSVKFRFAVAKDCYDPVFEKMLK